MKGAYLVGFMILGLAGLGFWYWRGHRGAQKLSPITTQQPLRRTVKQMVIASGNVEIKGNLKIGSLVSGTIKQILVKENDRVVKGQLLAIIDNGKSDTEVREARGALERARAIETYLTKNFNRQHELHLKGFLATDADDLLVQNLTTARADVKTAQATLEKKEIEYNNTRIKAPHDGIIVSVGITEGQRITTDLDATVLFEIARDLSAMEANLEVDESDIGHLKAGQKVKITADSYPHQAFKGVISDISYSPKTKNNIQCYLATADLANTEYLLRPGMTVNGRVCVCKERDAIALTNQAFLVDESLLNKIATQCNHRCKPLSRDERRAFKRQHEGAHVKCVWIKENDAFREVPVIISACDDTFFAIKHGLQGSENIIVDLGDMRAKEQP